MKSWKSRKTIKQAHDDLYKPSDPNDTNSDTYITLIIKSVFSQKECTTANCIWTQAVLETIFDENYLSPKIDADIINQWTQRLPG